MDRGDQYFSFKKGGFMARSQNYISLVRDANRKAWEGINELVEFQREWNALNYGATLPDGSGDNAGITAAQVGAVVFDSANAFVTVLNTGVATNMAKLL